MKEKVRIAAVHGRDINVNQLLLQRSNPVRRLVSRPFPRITATAAPAVE
jgi:hypothetical protein